MVKISKGNSKLGKVWNVSLSPVISCPTGVPCAKTGCYALKAYRQYPATQKAWDFNYRYYLNDGEGYFNSISNQLQVSYLPRRKPCKVFRWHVAGDIPDQNYFNGMVRVARENSKVKFLAYTKNYHLNFSQKPENLTIIFSAWPGLSLPLQATDHPIAWLSEDTRYTTGRFAGRLKNRCEGYCETCEKPCFDLSNKVDIIFEKH